MSLRPRLPADSLSSFKMNFIHFVFLTNIAWLTHSVSLDQCTSDSKHRVLRLLVLLPGGRCSEAAARASADYTQVRLAMDLAIEHINGSTLLPCHALELIYKESGCDEVTKTAVGLTSGLFPGGQTVNKNQDRNAQDIVGIIGPTDTLDSLLVSSITNRPDPLQIITLHGAGSSALGNRTMFPNSLSIMGSVQSLVDLSIALMKKASWNNIAILYESSSNWFYRTLKEQFIASLDNNTRILYSSIVTSNFYPVHDIATSKARVVFLFTSPEHSRRIMCLAYHTNMVYPSYQWVLMGQQLSNVVNEYEYTNVEYQGEKVTCSPMVVSDIALAKGFTINYQTCMINVQSKHAFTNLSSQDFQENMILTSNNYSKHSRGEVLNWDYVMYDAVWTWAVVLNKLLTSGKNISTYNNNKWIKETLVKFYSVDFQGMSGRITFNVSSGFMNRPVNLFFIFGGRETQVATYTNNGTIVTKLLQNTETISDTVTIVGLPQKGIVGFFLTVICIMFIVLVVLHALTLLYRRSKHLKASSPKLIQVAFLGEYIFLLVFLLYNVQRIKVYSINEGTIMCRLVWMWTLPLCFTLKMGIVIVRTWRIYRIFKHYLNPGRFISNPALLIILLIMVGINIVYATIWTAVDPMQFDYLEYTVQNGPTSELFMHQSCRAGKLGTIVFYMWLGVAFTYMMVLLLIMIMLSVLTRNIPNRTFATNSLRVFSYLFCPTFIIGFCAYYVFLLVDPGGYNTIGAPYIVLSVMFTILVLIFVAFVIVPPILPVLRNTLIKRKRARKLAAAAKVRQVTSAKR